MRAWSGVKIDMLARWEVALCSDSDIYWRRSERYRYQAQDMADGSVHLGLIGFQLPSHIHPGATRYAHDLPRSPYHRVGQVAQTIGQIQGRDNP
ncbi:MAG: hypothetical protein WC455_26435 [Dehalococcoidia bacterium]|jgi:hypothetical protein